MRRAEVKEAGSLREPQGEEQERGRASADWHVLEEREGGTRAGAGQQTKQSNGLSGLPVLPRRLPSLRSLAHDSAPKKVCMWTTPPPSHTGNEIGENRFNRDWGFSDPESELRNNPYSEAVHQEP
eukprot:763916-Hanusia_phi.AAC.7